MSASLIGSFVRRPVVPGAGYWLHIEQVLPEDDTASLGEVADLIDEIWGTSRCGEEESESASVQQQEQTNTASPISEEEYAEIVRTQFRPGLCGMNFNGDWPTQIKVAVSHPGEPYTLRLSNGRIVKTVAVDEAVSKIIVVDNAASVDLEFPALSGGSFTWRGSVYGQSGNMTGPPITLSGRTLSWGQICTGSIIADYSTRYDLVDVVVNGDDTGEPGECLATCFFRGLVDEIDMEQPDISDENEGLEIYRQPFCGAGTGAIGNDDNDQVTCYEDITYIYRCQCSKKEADRHTEYMVEVQCPPDIRCQGGADKCHAFMGSREVFAGYVDCGETTGDISDPEYRTRICCDDVVSLPRCIITYSKNPGGVPFDSEKERIYRAKYGEKLRIVAVSPADGDCGTIKTVIKIRPKNCCDVVEPMSWDADISAEVVAPGSRVLVGVIGGAPPYHWSVRGEGFTLDGYNMRDGYTDTPYTWIYASSISCGWCQITVSDGCSVVAGGVRSTLGHWVSRLDFNARDYAEQHISEYGGYLSVFQSVFPGQTSYSQISGKYLMATPEMNYADGLPFKYDSRTHGVMITPESICLDGTAINIHGYPFSLILYRGCDLDGLNRRLSSYIFNDNINIYEWVC
jgi:hypothetical protein